MVLYAVNLTAVVSRILDERLRTHAGLTTIDDDEHREKDPGVYIATVFLPRSPSPSSRRYAPLMWLALSSTRPGSPRARRVSFPHRTMVAYRDRLKSTCWVSRVWR